MRSLALLSVAVALLAVGCDRSVPMPANQADYFPLAEGNEWYMDAVKVSPSGEAVRGTAHRVLEKTVQRDGRTYLQARTSIEFPPAGRQEYTKLMRKDETGLHTTREEDPPKSEQIEIPFPLTVGHQWQRTDGTVTTKDQVIGVETITIGDVTFTDCCHIRSEGTNRKVVEDYWEAPKVGNVKSIVQLPDGSTMTITIHEFRPGK